MTRKIMSRGKFEGINACADENGIIAAAAMDQRGSLRKAIQNNRHTADPVSSQDMAAFKTAVIRVLSPHASAILLDPEYGLKAIQHKAPETGVLLSYEKTGYDQTIKGRLPDLLPAWSVTRLVEAGANAVKILLYYNPAEDPAINAVKHAFIERVGGECAAADVPFFLEPVYYNDDLNKDSLEMAQRKPENVTAYMAEFSKPRYRVDILKVEVPVNIRFVEGTRAFAGQAAYTRMEAMELFLQAARAARLPFIYLSAGVTDAMFRETLELAAESGSAFSGVLCGRATWQDGIPEFAKGGYDGLTTWLEDRGVENINRLNEVLLKSAKPWWSVYGGKDNIEVVG